MSGEALYGSVRIPSPMMGKLKHFRLTGPTIAGVSGGRTSALMHVLTLIANVHSPHAYLPVFANTGKEHESTLVFLRLLEERTGVPLTWLEFLKPPVLGGAPKTARWQEVGFRTANRDGAPFVAFLETLAEFRAATKDAGPVAPNSQQRMCTNYMKIRTMHRWAVSKVGPAYDKFVGLRADEPERVANLFDANRAGVHHLTPLANAGITKADVLGFWRAQSFDLNLPEYLGNCTKCFLKDEADLAQASYEDPGDNAWWLALQDRFGQFRGRDRVPMRTVFAEAPMRLETIRPAVLRGESPPCPEGADPRRWKLLVRQEERRKKLGATPFSCACETSQLDIEE